VRVEQFLLRAGDKCLGEFHGCFFVLAIIGVGNVKEFPHGEGRYHFMLVPEEALQCRGDDFHLGLHLYFYG
jgi:hypothetical protein